MRRLMAILVALGICIAPASAQAFDTGPHADMTRDALTAEGFGAAGANVGMVNNWFVDYYTNPDDNPYSGHANALVGFLRFKLNHEDWLHQWVEGARRMHFDAEKRQVPMPDLSRTAGVDKAWQRLMFLTRKWQCWESRCTRCRISTRTATGSRILHRRTGAVVPGWPRLAMARRRRGSTCRRRSVRS